MAQAILRIPPAGKPPLICSAVLAFLFLIPLAHGAEAPDRKQPAAAVFSADLPGADRALAQNIAAQVHAAG
jgi:hypothetical protein